MLQKTTSIFCGRATKYLGDKIAKSFGGPLGKSEVTVFADGEFQTCLMENVRGRDVYLIQSTFPPADNLFELLLMVDAARRASANSIIAVMPYFGFARQDRKDKPRVPISAKLIANLLTAAGVNRVITLDLHADQIQGFFDVPVDHLYASTLFTDYLKALKLPNLTMASPDTGGTRRAAAYAKNLGTDFVICYKQRKKPNVIAEMSIVGDVEGRDIVIVDDIIDTAGTITKAAHLMMENGAASVRAFCTHPVFSEKAYDRLVNAPFTEIVVTDTIPIRKMHKKFTVLSTADLFAEVIRRIDSKQSISSLFQF